MRDVADAGRDTLRRFTGSDARQWQVHRDVDLPTAPVIASSRMSLAFDCDDGERRILGGAPHGWEVLSDAVLRIALGAARDTRAARRAGSRRR
jgi:hypothetical protein